MKLYYMAHPVRPLDEGSVEGNVFMAECWYRWLCEQFPKNAYEVSWLTACEWLDDSDEGERKRGLERNCEMVKRCDGIILVGGHISTGMALELSGARKAELAVLDLTELGRVPPATEPHGWIVNADIGRIAGVLGGWAKP